jgi:hypothetical protein
MENVLDINNWILMYDVFVKLLSIWWPLVLATGVTLVWLNNHEKKNFSGWV